jgi:hypothetical protein
MPVVKETRKGKGTTFRAKPMPRPLRAGQGMPVQSRAAGQDKDIPGQDRAAGQGKDIPSAVFPDMLLLQ